MRISKLRYALAACSAITAVGLVIAGGTAANAATNATPTNQVTVQLKLPAGFSGKPTPNASSGAQLELCYMSVSASAGANDYVTTAMALTCQNPVFVFTGDTLFENNGSLYHIAAANGRSNGSGFYLGIKEAKGGTPGHRTVIWCEDITSSDGAIGSGCVGVSGV